MGVVAEGAKRDGIRRLQRQAAQTWHAPLGVGTNRARSGLALLDNQRLQLLQARMLQFAAMAHIPFQELVEEVLLLRHGQLPERELSQMRRWSLQFTHLRLQIFQRVLLT